MSDTGTADLLLAIVAGTRTRVTQAEARVPATTLEQEARAHARQRRFEQAIARPGALNVIAECKRRSPSRGVLRREYDPVSIARDYAAAGAAAISVLTEPTFFDGSLDHLAAVRRAVDTPLLRKDFVVSEYQLLEAAAAGADAVLLIVAALDDAGLAMLLRRAHELALDVLVEVHDEPELDRALSAGARIVGVNNRNLRTLTVDAEASRRLASRMPDSIVRVTESGLRTPDDLRQAHELGYDAALIGERFMTTPRPGEALAQLLHASGQSRRDGDVPPTEVERA